MRGPRRRRCVIFNHGGTEERKHGNNQLSQKVTKETKVRNNKQQTIIYIIMSYEINKKTEAEVVAEIAKKSVTPFLLLEGESKQELLVMPQTGEVKSLEKYGPLPVRKRAVIEVRDAVSFIGYVNAYKEAGTVIFGQANEQGGGFQAVVDYHLPERSVATQRAQSADTEGTEKKPKALVGPGDCYENRARWGEHRVKFALETSPEWQRWIGSSGKGLSQMDFALFLEDNAEDVIVPEGTNFPNDTDLMQVALTIQAAEGVQFKGGIRLQDGQQQLTFVQNIEAGAGVDGKMRIPEKFAIAVVVFKGGPREVLHVRLRYRVGGGKVTFFYEVERPWKAVERAFDDVREKIASETGLPVWMGAAGGSAV